MIELKSMFESKAHNFVCQCCTYFLKAAVATQFNLQEPCVLYIGRA